MSAEVTLEAVEAACREAVEAWIGSASESVALDVAAMTTDDVVRRLRQLVDAGEPPLEPLAAPEPEQHRCPTPAPPVVRMVVSERNDAVSWALRPAGIGGRMRTPHAVAVSMAAAGTAEAQPGGRYVTTTAAVSGVVGLAESTVRRYLREAGAQIERGYVVLPVTAP